MPSTSFVDGDGLKKNRSVRGTGTTADPFVSEVYVVNNTTGGSTTSAGIGDPADAAATTTTQATGLVGLLKGFWTAFGLISQASDTTGSLMQRIRGIADRIGSFGDAANSTGSIMAQLRAVADSHQSNRTTNTSPVAISAAAPNIIITPATGKSLRVVTLYFIAASAVAITFRRGSAQTSTAISGTMTLTTHAGDFDYPLCLGVNESFIINLGTAVAVNGYIVWFEV